MKKNLVLLGMMAVGKTTIARIVAKKYKLNFIDIDLNIQKKNLMNISEIFNKKGENFFSMFESVSKNFKSCFSATILPKVDLPTPIIPNKIRFFFTVTRNFKFDFSQLCLIFRV